MGKYSTFLSISEILLLLVFFSSNQSDVGAKEATSSNQQPLSQLDKILKQTNNIRVDSVMDSKLTSNVTQTLNEMAMNLRKMFMENRRLSNQVQDVLQRMQNATGVNATNTINSLQQQTPNVTSLTNQLNNINLNNLTSRFQIPQNP